MAIVIFYEKPGCINNTKQKTLLKAAGHEVQDYNLLTTAWTPEMLRLFFKDLPVAQWFNPTAPRVKSGEVVPEQLDADTALALMVREPLLIRRPLIQVGERREVGFDVAVMEQWIGLTSVEEEQQAIRENLIRQDLQTCPRNHD
jgi:nitrogenase-associated protein